MRKALKWALVLLLVAVAVFAVPTIWFKPWSVNHFYARVFIQFAMRHPMLLTALGISPPLGLDYYSDDLDDVSVEFALEEAAWSDKQLGILRSYDTSKMGRDEKLSFDVLDWYMADGKEQSRFQFHDYPVNQSSGIQSGLPEFMTSSHPITSVRGARTYNIRLSRFGIFLDQIIEGLTYREQRKILPPRFVLEKVLVEMKSFVDVPPKENALYANLSEKVGKLEDADADEKERLLGDAEQQIAQTVYPAYQRLIAVCERQLRSATTDDGVWKLPDGDAYYDSLLRHHTTSADVSADAIHALGLREVARLQAEMREIMTAQGLPADDIGATMKQLAEDPRFLYPDTDAGRAQILADYQKIEDDITAGLDRFVSIRPKAGLKVERMPLFREATAPVAYYDLPAFDGSKPGLFYVNLRSVKEHPKFAMRTLAYHEGVPGHHYQIAIAQELTGVPFFRKVIPFTSYIEGWALYAERLAAENGFEDDPFDRLGYLQAQLFRAVRLVVDTGIHRKRWTREQAIEYMVTNTGMVESDVVSEVERYIVDPGQACAYMVGQLKILELRDRARAKLGPKFDLRGFNRVLVANGSVPLTVLEWLVDEWIATAS